MKTLFNFGLLKHVIATLAIGCLLFVNLAHSEEPSKDKAQAKPQPKKNQPATGAKPANVPVDEQAAPIEFEIIRLKNANASQAANLLRGPFGGNGGMFGSPTIKIIEDPRTNSLLVSAEPKEMIRIRTILTKIDIAGQEESAPSPERLSVVPLRFIEPDKTLQQALQMVLDGKGQGNFTVDPMRKAVIIWGDENTHKSLSELLQRLEVQGQDQQKTSQPQADVQVRLAWLVNGPSSKEAQPVPPDLKEVLPGLSKLGIDRPHLAAQTLINVRPNTRFQAKGMVTEYNCEFSVTGTFRDQKEKPELQIGIRAMRVKEEICRLETEISAPLGHLVVLGMTPVEGATSVFVIQVLGPDTAKAPSRK
jgi:hypothetical protein